MANITGYDLCDVIQFHSMSKRSLVLEVDNDGEKGKICMDKGEVVHALCRDKIGEDALYECLSWNSQSITDLPWQHLDVRTINKPTTSLLLEAALSKDEESNGFQKPAAKNLTPMTDALNAAAAQEVAPTPKARSGNQINETLTLISRVSGVEGVIFIKPNGQVVLKSGTIEPSINTLTNFLMSMGEQLKNSLKLDRLEALNLSTSDRGAMMIWNLKSVYLCVLVKNGEPMDNVRSAIVNILRSQSKRKK